MTKKVFCKKYQKEMIALSVPPMPGPKSFHGFEFNYIGSLEIIGPSSKRVLVCKSTSYAA